MRVAKSGGGSPAPAEPAETPGSGLQDALLPPSSTLLGLGAGAPPLPGTCQAGRWAPMASRLAESPAACHAGCCRVGIANPLRSVPDGPPGWQGSPAPCCPLGRLSASPGWPAPRGSWPKLWQPGTVLSTWNHQDLQVLPGQVPCSRKAVSSGNAETESCLWHSSTLGSAAAPTRVSAVRDTGPPLLAPLIHCQSPLGWEAAQGTWRVAGKDLGFTDMH